MNAPMKFGLNLPSRFGEEVDESADGQMDGWKTEASCTISSPEAFGSGALKQPNLNTRPYILIFSLLYICCESTEKKKKIL